MKVLDTIFGRLNIKPTDLNHIYLNSDGHSPLVVNRADIHIGSTNFYRREDKTWKLGHSDSWQDQRSSIYLSRVGTDKPVSESARARIIIELTERINQWVDKNIAALHDAEVEYTQRRIEGKRNAIADIKASLEQAEKDLADLEQHLKEVKPLFSDTYEERNAS